jgi:hypothetical protein
MPISFDQVEMSSPPPVSLPESEGVTRATRARAVRAVASAAANAQECAALLDMLGLRAQDGLADPPAPAPRAAS